MKISILIVASVAAMLAGCSFAPVGENTFDCNRKSNPSEYCRSFKSLEKSTNGNLPESRFDKEFRMSDYDKAVGIAPNESGAAKKGSAGTIESGLLPHNMADRSDADADIDAMRGRPVRNTPVILRTWIKHYVDENDTYIGDFIAYKEVQSSKWSGAEAMQDNSSGNLAAYPHRSANSAKSASIEPTNTRQAPNTRQDSSPFSQPPAGDDETGMQPPASGASMPQ